MNQSKWHSLLEAWTSTLIGFIVSWFTAWLILPWFGFHASSQTAFLITLIHTAASIIRVYFVRRWFNRMLHRRLVKLGESHVVAEEISFDENK